MFAVIKTGGKQYRVAKDDKIVVESLTGEPGTTLTLNEVLMIGEAGKAPAIGTPMLDKAAVFAEVLEQTRGDKILVFKKRRRAGYRRKAGHRQHLTVLRITDISASGEKPAMAAAAKPENKAKPEAAAEAKAKPVTKTEAKPAAKAKSETAATAKKPATAKKESAKKESKTAESKE